jgi:hypothetical protein
VASERTPLDRELLRAELKVYEVTILVDRELADKLRKLPMFRDASEGQRSFLFSTHRVGPRKLFDLPPDAGFPSEYEIDQADDESQRCAQAKALELLKVPGVRLVNVSWRRRKEASGRYERGQALSGPVKRMVSEGDRWIHGEPSQKALDIDEGRL